MSEEDHYPNHATSCSCFDAPYLFLENEKLLGMDGNYAEISLLSCSICGQPWLKFFYEVEAFTASGRWYLGAITAAQASLLTAENGKAILEGLPWYFFGGSYFGGNIGKTAGRIFMNP